MAFRFSKAFLFLAVVALLLFIVPSQSEAAVLFVNGTSGSDSPGCGDESFPCQSIGMAISNAFADDTIVIAPGIYTAPSSVPTPILIQRDESESDPVVLQCAPNGTLLVNSTQGIVSIKDLLISECLVVVSSGVVRLKNLIFQNNSSVAILDNVDSMLLNCTFQDTNYGLYVQNAQVVVQNCTFSRIGQYCIFADFSFISVQRCTFHDNKGELGIFALFSTAEFDSCSFQDDHHEFGTIVIFASIVNVSDSTFERSSQLLLYGGERSDVPVLIENCTFTGSSQSQDPLVLVMRSKNVRFQSCSFLIPSSETAVSSLAIHFAVYVFSSVNVTMADCYCDTHGQGCLHGEISFIQVDKHRGPNRLNTSSISGLSVPRRVTAFFPFSVIGNSEAPSWSERTSSAFIRVVHVDTSSYFVVLANQHSISFSVPASSSVDGFKLLNNVILSSEEIGTLTITSLSHPVVHQTDQSSLTCIVVAGVSSPHGSGIALIRSSVSNPVSNLDIQSVLYWVVPDVAKFFGMVIDSTFDEQTSRFTIVTTGTDHLVLFTVASDYSSPTFLSMTPHGFTVSALRFFNGRSFLTAGCDHGFPNVAAFSIIDSTFTMHFRARLVPAQNGSANFTCTSDSEPFAIDVRESPGAASVVDAIVTDPSQGVLYVVKDVFGSGWSCHLEEDNNLEEDNTKLCLPSQERRTSAQFKKRAFGKSVTFLDSSPTSSDERFVVTFSDAIAFFANLSAETPYLKLPNRFVTDYPLAGVVVAPVLGSGLMVYNPELAIRGSMSPFLFPFTNTPGEMLDIIRKPDHPPKVERLGCTPGTSSNTTNDFSFCHACRVGTFQQNSNASSCIPCASVDQCPTGTVIPFTPPQKQQAPICFRESSSVVTFDSFIINAMFIPLSLSFYLGTLFVIFIIVPPLIFLLVVHCPCFSRLKFMRKLRELLKKVLKAVNFIGPSEDIPKAMNEIRGKLRKGRSGNALPSPNQTSDTEAEAEPSDEKPVDYVGSFLSLLFVVYILVFVACTCIFLFSCYCPDGDCEHPFFCSIFLTPSFGGSFPLIHFPSFDAPMCFNTHNTLALRPSEQFNSLITQLSKMPLHIKVQLDGVPSDQCNVEAVSIDPCGSTEQECANITAKKEMTGSSINTCLISMDIDPRLSYGDFVVSILFDSETWLPSRINSTLHVNGTQFGTFKDEAADHDNKQAVSYIFAEYPLYDLVYPASNSQVLYGPISRAIQRTFIVHEKSGRWPWPFQNGYTTAGALLNVISASNVSSKVDPSDFEFDENMQLKLNFRIDTTTHIEYRTTTQFVTPTGVFLTAIVAFLTIIKLFKGVHKGIEIALKIGMRALTEVPKFINKVLKRGNKDGSQEVELQTRSPPARGRSLLD